MFQRSQPTGSNDLSLHGSNDLSLQAPTISAYMVPTISAYTRWNCLATVCNYICQHMWRRWIKRQWRTIKAIDGRSTPKAENEAITLDGSQVTFPKQIGNYFNGQFTTSKLGRHTSSRDTRLVSREIKWKSLTSAVTFTTDQVTKGISSCSNT